LDVPGVVGLAVATALAVERRPTVAARVAGLRDELVAGVLERIDGVTVNGHPTNRLPGIANLTFTGCEGDALLMLLDAQGVECSTGSACSAGVAQPSHVLTAMGAGPTEARGTLRFSLGHTSTRADVAAALDAIAPAVERARRAGITSVAS
jgi:cysteine desulfurase